MFERLALGLVDCHSKSNTNRELVLGDLKRKLAKCCSEFDSWDECSPWLPIRVCAAHHPHLQDMGTGTKQPHTCSIAYSIVRCKIAENHEGASILDFESGKWEARCGNAVEILSWIVVFSLLLISTNNLICTCEE